MRMRLSMKQAQMKGRMPELSMGASEDSGVLYLCPCAPLISLTFKNVQLYSGIKKSGPRGVCTVSYFFLSDGGPN